MRDEASFTSLAGSVGGRALAAAIAFAAALRFIKWLLEFTAARLDVGAARVGERLKHVEQELDAYREATMLMINVVAKLDAGNPALANVARILRKTAPRATMDLDELEARLNQGGKQ